MDGKGVDLEGVQKSQCACFGVKDVEGHLKARSVLLSCFCAHKFCFSYDG